jgi:hypothetical protein
MAIKLFSILRKKPTKYDELLDNDLQTLATAIDNVEFDGACLPFDFKEGSVGPKVSFRKEAGSDPDIITNRDIVIPGLLEITRGNSGGGIYNYAQESSFDNNSPKGTTWNTQYVDPENTSWAPLGNITDRTYTTWKNAARTPAGNNAAPQYVGMPAIMHFTDGPTHTTRYYLVLFTEWGVGAYGQEGAFAYDRWEIYPQVNFTKVDYDDTAVDIISDGVHIKRGNNRPLYNAVTENNSEVGVSPTNTKWNSVYTDVRLGYHGWSDLSNLESRVFTDFTNALNYNIGANIIDAKLIMWDLTTDLYYKVQFTDWTPNNAGGGFAYKRIVIPQSCGVEFADGTVLNTAPVDSCKDVYTAGLYEFDPFAITPSMIDSCLKIKNTYNAYDYNLEARKIGGAVVLTNPSDSIYLGTVEATNALYGSALFGLAKITGMVDTYDNSLGSIVNMPLALNVYVQDVITGLMVQTEVFITADIYAPNSFDLYLNYAANTVNDIYATISFEYEFMFAEGSDVTFTIY